jgi:hypothetical protein
MIVVKVELHSAITKKITELARMHICNEGGTNERGEYGVKTFRGRDSAALDKGLVTREGKVHDYPRLAIHVWHLVYEALKATNYNRRPKSGTS